MLKSKNVRIVREFFVILLVISVLLAPVKSNSQQTSRTRIFEKPNDVTYHVWAGMLIGTVTGAVTYKITKRPGLSSFYAWLMAAMAGAAKEVIYDNLMHRGQPSQIDFISTMWGGTVSVIIVRVGIDVHEKKHINKELFEHYSDSLQFIRSCDTINTPTPIKFD